MKAGRIHTPKTDHEHVKAIRALAGALNDAAKAARKDGLIVELWPNGDDADLRPYVSREYEMD
ncbi:hypothetical protein VPG91_11695 [Nitrospirillum amazonense]|uniref:hypothetical protein n=1 Tax=Nitrospirillum amazonense TaxID=28077 RepID=UPI002DD42030|nr:hypothetical protein [Nitrospirillum amazonense]MEC4591653.1 hypothetical protein [Nitrospirillum amazonense]